MGRNKQRLAAYAAMVLVTGCSCVMTDAQGAEPTGNNVTHNVVVTATRSEQELSKVPALLVVMK